MDCNAINDQLNLHLGNCIKGLLKVALTSQPHQLPQSTLTQLQQLLTLSLAIELYREHLLLFKFYTELSRTKLVTAKQDLFLIQIEIRLKRINFSTINEAQEYWRQHDHLEEELFSRLQKQCFKIVLAQEAIKDIIANIQLRTLTEILHKPGRTIALERLASQVDTIYGLLGTIRQYDQTIQKTGSLLATVATELSVASAKIGK